MVKKENEIKKTDFLFYWSNLKDADITPKQFYKWVFWVYNIKYNKLTVPTRIFGFRIFGVTALWVK
jgi:hypothetical protein